METDPLNATKINILFHEYDNLSQNILSRYGFLYSLIWAYGGVLAGLFAAWVANSGKTIPLFAWCFNAQHLIVCAAIVVTVAFMVLQIWIDHDVWKAAAQLRMLESKINDLFGEPLLSWETKFGGGGMFWTWLHRWLASRRPPPLSAGGT